MKGVDTSVLLALLDGERPARELIARQRGVEIATTELNLLELYYLASRGPSRSRAGRRASLERLRRKLTVLPVDARAIGQAARRLGKGGEKAAPVILAMLGAFEANGCEELFTHEVGLDAGSWSFKITQIKHHDA